MNFLRGILSIGIATACMLNWVDIDTEMLMFSFSGLTWVPSIILLYVSVFTAGYAFYDSYRKSNQNAWIYLTCGLYGSGVSILISLSVLGNFGLIYTFLPSRVTDQLGYDFGLGLYLTGLFSFLLFLTGFDKSDRKAAGILEKIDQQYGYMGQRSKVQTTKQENFDKSDLRNWTKENPGKSINDYYSKRK